MGENVNIFESHVNVHQRVTSAKEHTNSQMDRTTCSMDTIHLSHPSFLVIPVIIRWVHEQSSHGDRNGRYSQAQQYGLPLTNVNLTTAITECPLCQ